jgi:hypothetical protein
VGELIGVWLIQSDSERVNRLRCQPCHQRREQARIHTSGQEQPQRDVAHQVALDGALEPAAKLTRVLDRATGVAIRVARRLPVPACTGAPAGRPGQGSARQQLAYADEERLLVGDEAGGEELREDRPIESRAERARCEDRLNLGREQQLMLGLSDVQRFDP